jgi:site-specific DNA-methyltransferase (adenine-specific)
MEEYIDKIWNEDCLVGMDRIPDKSVDCIICDLPYGTTACSWDSVIPFDKLWEQYKRIRKDNAAIILFGSEPFSSYLRMSNINEFRYDWIWVKTGSGNFQLCKKNPLKYHEIISVFYKDFPTYKNTELINCHINNGRISEGRKTIKIKDNLGYIQTETGYNRSVLFFNSKFSRDLFFHPTQKPVDLIRYLIRTYTNPGDLILDNCMGSGTTAVAAINEGRHFTGFELEEKYFNICLERIKDAEEIKAVEDAKIRLF